MFRFHYPTLISPSSETVPILKDQRSARGPALSAGDVASRRRSSSQGASSERSRRCRPRTGLTCPRTVRDKPVVGPERNPSQMSHAKITPPTSGTEIDLAFFTTEY